MLQKELYLNTNGFLRSKNNYEKSKAVIVGVPMDFTVSFRPGTRMGPKKIREVSYGLEDYSPYLDDNLNNKNFYDAGDLDLPFGNVEKSLKIIEKSVENILEDGKIPVFLGGEHLISYPLIKKVAEKNPELAVLHFDAHADLRDEFFGEKLSHATVLRRACEHIKDKRLYQFGIRSGVKEEFDFISQHGYLSFAEVKEGFMKKFDEFKNYPLYITIDIDVFDPAYAPGTGTPEPGGCTSKDFFDIIPYFKKLNIVGIDLVEVSPINDISERTSLLAAKILREILICLC
ncbi:MAG: agmatinase [Thermovenabulum sp.]|uniref:agmatinase n=1 Tax=Thermovenabulum sp. TaxID=3100335 RepID=UPI003C7B4B95